MKYDGRTSEYVARRTSEGKSKREAIRCLKRYVAREVYRALMSPKATAHARGLDLRKSRPGLGWTQAQVAEALGTQPIRISEMEREARKHFDIRDRYEGLMVDLSKKVRNGS